MYLIYCSRFPRGVHSFTKGQTQKWIHIRPFLIMGTVKETDRFYLHTFSFHYKSYKVNGVNANRSWVMILLLFCFENHFQCLRQRLIVNLWAKVCPHLSLELLLSFSSIFTITFYMYTHDLFVISSFND